MHSDWVTLLDGVGCADELAASRARIVEAELTQVRLVEHWCDLHSGPVDHVRPALPGAERAFALGAGGTPPVREFAAGELGLLLGLTTTSARSLMRDVLDLRHRHPRLHRAVLAGEVRFFQARHVVRATHAAGLTSPQARGVDARVAPYLGQVTWGRLQALVEAAVIAADPEAAEQRRLAADLARFVRTGRSSEFGTMTIYARARAGDAIFFYAMCDRIAQILRMPGARAVLGRDDAPEFEMDVLRSEAVGILATPARAAALLAWAEQHEPDVPLPAEALLPRATLYVHLSEDAFRGRTREAAWVEDVGPVTVEQSADLLGHCHVTVRPVLDLNVSPAVDGYRPSRLIRETVELRHPVEVFPHGTLSSRKADHDHTRPYEPPDDGGPPGQTTPDNLGPLGRYHHRLKTFGGWQCHRTGPGEFLWRSPHGHWARVDTRGTRYLGRDPYAGVATGAERHFQLLLAS